MGCFGCAQVCPGCNGCGSGPYSENFMPPNLRRASVPDQGTTMRDSVYVERLEADNERLRAALKKIAELRYVDANEPFDEALDIADAALEPKP
jgi:hypothetical protein